MTEIVARYFAAFNAKDTDAMLACVSDDVVHHVNQGAVRQGKEAFAAFCDHMNRCYDEHLEEIVLFSGSEPGRVAAEFNVRGTYLATDDGLPEARGQAYLLPAGSFFDVTGGRISRVTTYYNLTDWLSQIDAA